MYNMLTTSTSKKKFVKSMLQLLVINQSVLEQEKYKWRMNNPPCILLYITA